MSETKKSDFPSDLGAWYMKAWKDAVNKEHCDNCAKKSDKKTLVQIRDELASSYGYGPMSQNDFEKLKYFKPDNSKVAQEMSKMSFQAGFDAATVIHQERTKKLVEALEWYANRENWIRSYIFPHGEPAISPWADKLKHQDCAMINCGGGRARLALMEYKDIK